MNPLWSWVLTAIGLTGAWLVGRKRRAGFLVGVGNQVTWIAYALSTSQFGFLPASVLWAAVYFNNWRRWRREAQ